MLKEFMRKFKPLEILNEEQVEAIHRGTLNVIETTGVRVDETAIPGEFAERISVDSCRTTAIIVLGWLGGHQVANRGGWNSVT